MTSLCDRSTKVIAVMGLVLTVLLTEGCTQSYPDRIKKAKQALDFVERTASSSNCSGGTENVLSLTFNTSAWVTFTDPAIRTANFLSQLLASSNNSFQHVASSTFYDLVRNNVHGDTLIFGSAIALEPDLLAASGINANLFCPYASKTVNGTSVKAFDLSNGYNYTSNSTEWYTVLRGSNFSDVSIVTDDVTIDSAVGKMQLHQPVSSYQHGHWTSPYYDCGGGNIWMVTYSAPILALTAGAAPLVFKGVATIDLELTSIDINQCDAKDDDAGGSLDVFRGTHNCQPTTQCVPVTNQGFKRGSYKCECLDGYYFPDTEATVKAFSGYEIDLYFSNVSADGSVASKKFQCALCARGCDRCVDSTPCLYEYNIAVRLIVVSIVVLLIFGCAALSFVTYKYRKERVMKTASPVFLQVMVGGAMLMCASVFLIYPEPNDALCTLFVWQFHLGFVLLYGSLLIKTWRISVIFRSRKIVNLTDNALLQRLLPVLAVVVVYLACWTGIGMPQVVTVTMANSSKFFACSFDYWNYAVFGAEALMLLVGVYLCFTVRKAPAHFNESKHITWSTYNAIILGTFIITLTHFLSTTEGPDVVYILLMIQLQVFVTITLCLIFLPKMWALHKGTGMGDAGQSGAEMTVTGRVKPSTIPSSSTPIQTHHVAVQVSPGDLLLLPHLAPRPSHSGLSSSEEDMNKRRPSAGLRTNRVAPATCLETPGDSHLSTVVLPATLSEENCRV